MPGMSLFFLEAISIWRLKYRSTTLALAAVVALPCVVCALWNIYINSYVHISLSLESDIVSYRLAMNIYFDCDVDRKKWMRTLRDQVNHVPRLHISIFNFIALTLACGLLKVISRLYAGWSGAISTTKELEVKKWSALNFQIPFVVVFIYAKRDRDSSNITFFLHFIFREYSAIIRKPWDGIFLLSIYNIKYIYFLWSHRTTASAESKFIQSRFFLSSTKQTQKIWRRATERSSILDIYFFKCFEATRNEFDIYIKF